LADSDPGDSDACRLRPRCDVAHDQV